MDYITINGQQFSSATKCHLTKAIKQQVEAYFRKSGKARRGGLETSIAVSATLVLFYLPLFFFIGFGNNIGLAWVVLLAIVRVPGRLMMGTVIMHAAVHNALFERSLLNKMFSYGFDAGYGMSWINWRVQHNLLHHTFTNVAGLDDDLEYTAPAVTHGIFSDLRIGLTRFQHYYWPIAYAFNLVLGPMADFIKARRYHRAGLYERAKVYSSDTPLKLIWAHLLGLKLVYVSIEFVIPILAGIPVWHVITFWLIATMFNSVLLIAVFQFAHVVEGTPQFESTDADKSMFRHQIETTANFTASTRLGTWLLDHLFGRLTFQIEHHLFPRINPIHYRVLSEIVKEEIAKHNAQYGDQLTYRTFPSLCAVIRAHHVMIRTIAKNGRSN